MAPIPQPQETTIRAIDKAIEDSRRSEPERTYLGASVIGQPCERALWYDFRWCGTAQTKFPGRVLRLFRYGHHFESAIVVDLRNAGIEVHTHNSEGEQFGYKDVAGHFAGHMDGVVRGLVEDPEAWHVLECKTHKNTSFNALEKNGVKKSKPEHYAQCQIYMHWSGIPQCYYLAENKDTSALYSEIIPLDEQYVAGLIEKARRIIYAEIPPSRVSEKSEYYLCKWCDHQTLCHGPADTTTLPRPSCRTCLYSRPETGRKEDTDAAWKCIKHHAQIPHANAVNGCKDHQYIPALVNFAEHSEEHSRPDGQAYKTQDGRTFGNGTPSAEIYSSMELHTAAHTGSIDVLFDDAVNMIRGEFNAEIVNES